MFEFSTSCQIDIHEDRTSETTNQTVYLVFIYLSFYHTLYNNNVISGVGTLFCVECLENVYERGNFVVD